MTPVVRYRRTGRFLLGLLASLVLAAGTGSAVVFGQVDPKAGEPRASTPPASLTGSDRLAVEQQDIAAKFQHFEQILLRMAELTAPTDPKRAALLRRAVALSKEQLIGLQLDKLVDVLKHDQLAAAVADQEAVVQEMAQLLELLLSEQRGDKIKDERERLKRELQQLKELINKQVELKAETGRAPDLKSLAPAQGKLAEEAGRLADAGTPQSGDPKASKPGEEKPGEKPGKSDKEKGEKEGGDKQPKDAKPQDAPSGKPPGDKQKPGDKQPEGEPKSGKPSPDKQGEAGKPEKSPADKSKPQDGEPSDSQGKPKSSKTPPMPGTPGQPMPGGEGDQEDQQAQEQQQAQAEEQQPGKKRIAAARERMEKARKELEDAKRDKAEKEQEEALRELEKAKAELEEILRQLRDEEVERVLAQLEARFRHMLALQREVYEGTRRVDSVPAAKRGRGEEIEAARLGRKEALIVIEADKTLTVLRDEGSAVAMPEAVEQMREDMESIVSRLSQAKIDVQTLGLEEDVIAALEEMIAALEKAQRDKQSGKQPPPPGGAMGAPQEPPLVDRISELKMIRALQMRVNTRTQRYSKLVQGDLGQAETEDLLQALHQLAEREERIYRTTRDIVIGKNQ